MSEQPVERALDRPVDTRGLNGEVDDDHSVIVIGGHPPDSRILGVLPSRHRVICADSGLDHALRLGLTPDVVIGDMDSVDHSSLAKARAMDCTIIEHSVDKDFTDTELALEYAIRIGSRDITLVWGGGDRIDHVLGVIAALGHDHLAALDSVRAWIATDRIDVVHAGRNLVTDNAVDTTISLITLGTRNAVVTTRGLKWDLNAGTLTGDRARGVSNLVVSSPCSIHCQSGTLAVISPGYLSDRATTGKAM
jgi:thiamine pyrophosphokinase